MSSSQRTLTIEAPIAEVWQVVSDPHHMARWWPGVKRIEGVDEHGFTQVFISRRGNTVRADHEWVERLGPGEAGVGLARISWRQIVEGTPFERVLAELVTEMLLEGGALPTTRVTLAEAAKMRGYSRSGGFLVKRAAAKRLGNALDTLAGLF